MNKIFYWLLGVLLTVTLMLGSFIDVYASNANTTNQTYYVSPIGSDSNNCSLEAPCASVGAIAAQPGDTITLLAGSYNGQMDISLKGTQSAPIRISGSGAILNGGSVMLADSEWLIFENLTFKNAPTSFDVKTSHYITWRDNVFDYITSGLYIREHSSYLLIENNEFYQSCLFRRPWMQINDATCEGSAVFGSSYNSGPYLIRNNYIHDVFNSFLFTDDVTGEWMDVNVFIYNNRFEHIINNPEKPEEDPLSSIAAPFGVILPGYPGEIPANIVAWLDGNAPITDTGNLESDMETLIPAKHVRSLKDILLILDAPQELAEWVYHNIEYDMQRYELADSLGCDALAPEDIYKSGKAICTEYARLFCFWAKLHDADCYQVGYTTGEWAHSFAWLPEYHITLQNNGVLHEYDTDEITTIVEQESYGQAVCFVVEPGGSSNQCIYCHLN